MTTELPKAQDGAYDLAITYESSPDQPFDIYI
jgi:hypothetical protein